MPLIPANAASITVAQPVAHEAVPNRSECCCVHSQKSSRAASQAMILFEQHPYIIKSAKSRASEHRCATAAAEFGRLAVRADSPLFSGLGAASAAAGWCISAGAPSTSTVDSTRAAAILYENNCYRYDFITLQINQNLQ